jgi:hypothetical protein
LYVERQKIYCICKAIGKVHRDHCIPEIAICVGWMNTFVGVDQPDVALVVPGMKFVGLMASIALVVVPVILGP